MSVLVYSKSNCSACKATYMQMDSLGITYEIKDVESSDEYMNEVLKLGYRQLPVVVVQIGETYLDWSGFDPDKIKKTLTFMSC